jgi:hypothetical protein
MDDTTRNKVAEKLCTQCGASADFGRIFCTKCGAELPPGPQTQSTTQDVKRPPNNTGSMKRVVVTVVKGMAGIAAVVFILCPLSTGTQVLLFGGSIVVLLICHFVLSDLDEHYIDEHMKDGYWPQKPIDWGPLPDGHNENEKRTANPTP